MGVTALFHATIHGELDCLERLIAKRANVNAADEVSAAPPAAPNPPYPRPHTPRSPSAIPVLPPPALLPPTLNARATVAAPPQAGSTALMYAARNGKLDCLDLLITRGANLETKGPVSAALQQPAPSTLPPLALRRHRIPSRLPRLHRHR